LFFILSSQSANKQQDKKGEKNANNGVLIEIEQIQTQRKENE